MRAIVLLPNSDSSEWLSGGSEATLIDRPFLRHVIEFIVDQGIRKIDLLGFAADSLRSTIGDGARWGAQVSYHESAARQPFGKLGALIPDESLIVLARGDSLPAFPLKRLLASQTEVLVDREDLSWTGWSILRGELSRDVSRAASEVHLRRLLESSGCCRVIADRELRCGNPELLWKAHHDAMEADLTGIFYTGRELRPGVWAARNAFIHPTARVVPPVYVGENSRIGKAALIGPCSVIGRDCLISDRTVVKHSVVLEGTYVGSDLELDHTVAQKRTVFDVRSGVVLEQVDKSLFDSLPDLPFAGFIGSIASKTAAFLILLPALLPLLFYTLFSTLISRRVPWTRLAIVQTPAPSDESRWKTTEVWTLCADHGQSPSFLARMWFYWLPSLVSVLQGNLRLTGCRAATPAEVRAMPDIVRRTYLNRRTGSSGWLFGDPGMGTAFKDNVNILEPHPANATAIRGRGEIREFDGRRHSDSKSFSVKNR
jgi:hypothetical protein